MKNGTLLLALLLGPSAGLAQEALSINGPQVLNAKDGKIRVVPVEAWPSPMPTPFS